ncbi:MAG: asparagine synthase (glutamine-hydrolyzing) [Anaerolineae bacterium]|nr:asparagine synthase (glutamine-hydrolyzing) [Anaerolineae bacterium]
MCGIYGHFNPGGADSALIERMAFRLAHRGPDGSGAYRSGALAFGAGRLAIIDLSAGVQPIFNETRSVAVVFNGEIYNYQPLRAELERAGHVFTTRTDTEVIVHGYEQWGIGVLERLRGMFALGVWDEMRQQLMLSRDRLGEKPLYYTALADGEFLFASEAKALFEHPGVPRAVNVDALPPFLLLGYVPPPQTLFAGIEKLAPGEYLTVSRDGLRRALYWQPIMNAAHAPDYPEAVRQVRAALSEAVQMQMMSDVPIGAFLSGGVDSTAIVALMQQVSSQPVQTFTVGFDAPPGSKADAKFNVDSRYAELAARRLGTSHHIISMRQDERLCDLLPHLIYAMDEPMSMPAIVQTAYVSALARQNGVPVLLSGEAGDELFFGYNHYRTDRLLDRYLKLPALLRNHILTPLLERLPIASLNKLASKSRQTDPALRYLTWLRRMESGRVGDLLSAQPQDGDAFTRQLRALMAEPNTSRFTDRIAYADLRVALAENMNMRVDKMCMALSVESRAPMQDYRLVELALSLPLHYKLRRGDSKTVFKDAVADLVPPEILKRPKWGFIPPASEWMRTILRPLVERVLTPERVAAAGIFRPETVARIVQAHVVERRYEMWSLWTVLVFQLWHDLYISRSMTLDHRLAPADFYPPA